MISVTKEFDSKANFGVYMPRHTSCSILGNQWKLFYYTSTYCKTPIIPVFILIHTYIFLPHITLETFSKTKWNRVFFRFLTQVREFYGSGWKIIVRDMFKRKVTTHFFPLKFRPYYPFLFSRAMLFKNL